MNNLQEMENIEGIKDIIICLIGPSCSGKTTLVELLSKNMTINFIESYTTRNKRFTEEIGHTFSNLENYELALKQGQALADETYLDSIYWIEKHQFLKRGISICMLEPKGFEKFKTQLSGENNISIVPIYIDSSKQNRMKRFKLRGDKNIKDKIKEDEKLFTKEFKNSFTNIIVNNDRPIKALLKLRHIINESIEQIYKLDLTYNMSKAIGQ